MRTYTLGFVGAGNMANAIIKGAVEKAVVSAQQVYVFDVDTQKSQTISAEIGIVSVSSLKELYENAEIIVAAVKPNVMAAVLQELKPFIGSKPIVSIAAGWSADMIKAQIGQDKKVMRLMPNTPLLVGEGMSVFETPSNFADEETAFVESVFSALGKIDHVPCKNMDAVTAVSGSGPAYVFMFIEALADAGVLCGLTRAQAQKLAAQTVMGSAKMVLDTGSHPGVLKDAVCSPGGTTIEAVKSLENDGFRGAVINAVAKCAEKSQKMSKI
jgi:pyrroline-5-carboxylate reductase